MRLDFPAARTTAVIMLRIVGTGSACPFSEADAYRGWHGPKKPGSHRFDAAAPAAFRDSNRFPTSRVRDGGHARR
jgi:hypothetical protein